LKNGSLHLCKPSTKQGKFIERILTGKRIDPIELIGEIAIGGAIGYLAGEIVPRGPGRPAKNMDALLFGKLAQRSYERQIVKIALKELLLRNIFGFTKKEITAERKKK
jgi:hypothetical protein